MAGTEIGRASARTYIEFAITGGDPTKLDKIAANSWEVVRHESRPIWLLSFAPAGNPDKRCVWATDDPHNPTWWEPIDPLAIVLMNDRDWMRNAPDRSLVSGLFDERFRVSDRIKSWQCPS